MLLRFIMKYYVWNRIIPVMFIVFILQAGTDYLQAAPPPSTSVSKKYQIGQMISVNFKDEKHGTRIKVLGNGKIYEYVTKKLDSPPRILVDILTVVPTFETMTIPIKSFNIGSMRIGRHSKSIRIVLDIKGKNLPRFMVSSDREGLTIFVKSYNPDLPSIVLSPRQLSEQGNQTKQQITMEEQGGKNSIADRQQVANPEATLTQLEIDDGQGDTVAFLAGLNSYKTQNWSDAIEKFNHLIKIYPSGRYTEKTYFLLAKSYEQLYSNSIPTHFKKITNHYEDAINNYPKSVYVQGALLSIGDLCFKIKYYTEALGYYNLVLKKDERTSCVLPAMIQKAKILHLKKRRKEALSILEDLVSRNPHVSQETEAKMEMSKILHELNAFHKSLDILSGLITANPQNIYEYPEISLYLGYNYHQLGDHVRARKNLFRFYNICPDREMNHMILAKIGDTYMEEGFIEDAVKIYQLVLERYPDTDGAHISLIRIAEQQEEKVLKKKSIVSLPAQKIGNDIGTPREIYENIINNPPDKTRKNPLTQLALIKLAVLHQKENNYEESIEVLKKVLKNYPGTSFDRECQHALQKTVGLMFKEEMKKEKYISIINTYTREKELFSIINSPEPFLTIARACIHQNFEDMATEMFRKADFLLQDEEKPPDLLFFLSKSLFEKERFINALERLQLLIDNYPSDKYARYAFRLKGNIFSRQKRYAQAAEMFSSALQYPLTRCEKTILLMDKAGALAECGFDKKAFEALREADSLKGACHSSYDYIYQEIGDLYFNLGYPKQAAAIFNQAIDIAKEKATKVPLKLKVAQCYWRLNKRKDSLALYEQISSLNDPFWSNLAKERIEEINFDGLVKSPLTQAEGG